MLLASSAALALAIGGCAALAEGRAYVAVGDHWTGPSPGLAAGGHTETASPPPGVRWTTAVAGFDAGTGAASHYAMRVTLVDDAMPAEWRLHPLFEAAVLVDDEGGQFPCTRALVPDPAPDDDPDEDEGASSREYTFVFAVPTSYRFSRITTLAVHWTLAVDGVDEPLRITTRFRVS